MSRPDDPRPDDFAEAAFRAHVLFNAGTAANWLTEWQRTSVFDRDNWRAVARAVVDFRDEHRPTAPSELADELAGFVGAFEGDAVGITNAEARELAKQAARVVALMIAHGD